MAEACGRLTDGTYWLATVRPDSWPHVVPVLTVWLDGALHFTSNPTACKATNLARGPRPALRHHRRSPALDVVVEGEATKVRDDAKRHRVAEV